MKSEVSNVENEWFKLLKEEDKFIASRLREEPYKFNEKIDEYIPDKLRETLKSAFKKAFEVIFLKGSGIIGKTFNNERYEYEYKVNEFSYGLKSSKRNLTKFSKKALKAKNVNLIATSISGIGMGVVGVGLPDIPIFTSMLLRSIYEIGLSYGFGYSSISEKIFILKLIEVSMKFGVDFAKDNAKINKIIEDGTEDIITIEEQILNTSSTLANAMLYMKFIQGIPIVGAIGGAYDFVYMNKITKYATLKYKRKFITRKREL